MKVKHLLFNMLIVALLFFLVGCGNEETDSKQVENTDHLKEALATRTFIDVTGREIEIPVEPKRIVTTQYLDALLALGVKPVGVPSHVLDNKYLGTLQENVADLGHPFSLEKIIELEPDLIIAANQEEVEQLSKVAPTVVVPWMHGDVFTQLFEIARVIDKEKEAKEWIATQDAKASEGREKIRGKIGEDEVVSIFMVWGKDTLRIYGGRNIGHMFYRALQLTPPPFIQERLNNDPDFKEFVFENISMEMLPEFAGDRIIMLVYGQEARDEGGMLYQLEHSSLWKNLDAVKNNKVYYVEEDPWFIYSPIAIDKSLDEAIKLFAQ
ncbi:ABC transporter substrate-binding protein [Caldalkalibacillus mannanilyticus]|uniref:ABC transporter substrate-binding protein n=1 Tax=Caldalkalibacillus mannanilyticus TaxID=1418 RepID=UPI00046AA03B|nr:ABC transporter substrate-binding protein [Caldalkalibacillus mannanilyticus]